MTSVIIHVQVFEKLQSCEGACVALNGVAGSGKSLFAAGCGIAVSELNGDTEKVVCIAKTRKMRMSLLNILLSLLLDKGQVIALGRPLGDDIDSDADEQLSIFDHDTRASIVTKIQPLKTAFDSLKKQLDSMPSNMFCFGSMWDTLAIVNSTRNVSVML